MAAGASSRRRRGGGLDAWPGYVDALSVLLMVIVFVLLVFVSAQGFLSASLSGRERALDRLNRQVAELTEILALERGQSGELRQSLAQLTRDLAVASDSRESLAQQLAALRETQTRLESERDGLRTDRDRLSARLADADTQTRSAAARVEQLERALAEARTLAEARGRETAGVAGDLTETRRRLTAERDAARAETETARTETEAARTEAAEAARQAAAQLAELQRQVEAERATLAQMRREMEALDRQVTTDRETIEARLSDIARLSEQVRALQALREELERRAADAAARTTTEEERRAATESLLAEQTRLGESARAQVALLNRQMEELRAQLGRVAAALDAAEESGRDKDTQIANLGSRLNAALAARVEELTDYRSEFFGRLRQVLGDRPGIQIVGDRFVFQSEVLFPTGSADLTEAGRDNLRNLAATLRDLLVRIPRDIPWVLRVDGHADRAPVTRAFASNWELSAQRAINVVKLLIDEGIPATRLAATGFGEFQPIDPADTPAAFARNRRIEIRLTDR